MVRKLKVFVVAVGFHDAYVAAPSRKAALEAWGSDHDLFARGIAHEVTDPALTETPLAEPGKVIKRSRGSAEEQVAALPPDAPSTPKRATVEAEDTPAKSHKTAPAKPVKVEPRPSRDDLDTAETAAAEAEKRHRAEDKALTERQATLDRDRREAAKAHAEESEALADALETAKGRYERAMKRWRG